MHAAEIAEAPVLRVFAVGVGSESFVDKPAIVLTMYPKSISKPGLLRDVRGSRDGDAYASGVQSTGVAALGPVWEIFVRAISASIVVGAV